MSGWLAAMGPEGTVLALLVLGHVLADFALQNEWMLENKDRPAGLLAHGLVVLAVQAIVLAPALTLYTLLLVGAIALAHVLVDGVKGRVHDPEDASLGVFGLDQLAHLLVLLAVWSLVPETAWQASPLVGALDGLPYQAWTSLTTVAVYASALVFVHHGGNTIVQGVLALLPEHEQQGPDPSQEDSGLEGAGELIGTLERLLVLGLVLASRWEAVALVIAAKSIARFEELRDRPFAEYFLVGTLASVLVAVALALLVGALV